MKIELIGYSSCDDSKEEKSFKASIMREVLTTSTSDIVVFPGSSILSMDDFMSIINDITITIKVRLVIFEVVVSLNTTKKEKKTKSEAPKFSGEGYCYDIAHRRFILNAIKQKYATGADLDKYPCLFDAMYDEWNNGLRSFKYGGKTFTVLMCGETAMLKCNMVNRKMGPAQFRFNGIQALAKFQKIIDRTDVFLNPIHTIQGNQGKIKRRREVLSSSDRVYFSTASVESGKVSAKSVSLQYAVCNSLDLQPIPGGMKQTGKYISRVFEI